MNIISYKHSLFILYLSNNIWDSSLIKFLFFLVKAWSTKPHHIGWFNCINLLARWHLSLHQIERIEGAFVYNILARCPTGASEILVIDVSNDADLLRVRLDAGQTIHVAALKIAIAMIIEKKGKRNGMPIYVNLIELRHWIVDERQAAA